jgi:sortase A
MTSKNIFLIIAGVLIVVGAAIIYALPANFWQGSIAPIFNDQNPPPQSLAPGIGLPVQLTIPSINVDAKIIYVALAPDGSVDTPKGPSEVAWYQLGPRPGEQGSSVITGHYGPWRSGAGSVFDNLSDLKKGDKVYVKDDKGETLTFEVRESRLYQPDQDAKAVFNVNDGKHLNLITCSGDWLADQKTYTQRLVVFTDRVE